MKLISAMLLCAASISISDLFMFSGLAQARPVDCSKHKIYCAISDLQPKVDKTFAMELSNLIYREAKKAKIDPMISVAIAMQETSLKHRLNRKQRVIVEKIVVNCDSSEKCVPVKKYEIVSGYTDMGLFQFHVDTITAYKLDLNKLENLEYVVKSHFKILKDKIKQCKRFGKQAWTCYHSSTPKYRNRYYNDVMKHYKKIKEQ